MSRFRELAWKYAGVPLPVELRDSFSQPTQQFLDLFGISTASGVSVTLDRARSISAVHACVDLISKTVAALPARVYRRLPAGREEQVGHPVNRLLRVRPNGVQTPFQFRSYMQGSLSLRGNAYALIERDQFFQPVSLRPVNPDDVQVLKSTKTDALFYRHKSIELTSNEMLHIRGVQTENGVGLSPLAVMRETLGLALATQEHGARLFSNGAQPGGVVIQTPAGTVADQVEKLRIEWDKTHRGLGNTGRPAILYGGMELKSIGFSNEDAQFLESRKFGVEEIARFYGVPLALIQSTEKSTSWGSGIEQLVQGFVKFTIAPLVINWEQQIGNVLLTEEELEQGFYIRFSLDGLLRGDQKSRYAAYAIGRQWGWLSANDVRGWEELDDLPDAQGDLYMHPSNMIPAGMVPDMAPAATED